MNAINRRGYQDVPMTRRRAQLLAEYANKLADMLEAAPDNRDLAEWVQSKVDRAADQIQSAYHYLDQEDDEELEKAVGHKYTHRKRVGTDKRGRARYRYYYAEHQGGGISRASFEAGSAFRLTWKGRRGHFHIDRVEGDQVFITHDSRPDMEPVAISKSELRALLKSQHGKAEQEHVEKRRKEVEKIKSRNVKRGLGLALHRLRQAAQVAGVELDERYQRKPKKTRAKVAETAREDRFDTMPEVESAEDLRAEFKRKIEANEGDYRLYVELFNVANYSETLANVPDSELFEHPITQELLSLTGAYPNDPVYIYLALQELPKEYTKRLFTELLRRYKETGERPISEGASVGIMQAHQHHFEQSTAPTAPPPIEEKDHPLLGLKTLDLDPQQVRSSYRNISHTSGKRAESERREWAETLDQLEAQAESEIQAGASREEVEKRYQKLAQRLLRAKQSVISARAQTASSAITGAGQFNARQAQKRQQTLERREAEYRQALQKIKDTQPPTQTTPRNQLTETAQQIIEEANQDHEERHEEHQEITRYELGEHTHTKTGAKLYTAKQKERTDRDEYFRRLEIAKKYKGRYERRYVKGFVFKTAEDARAFALEVEGAAQEAPETSAETVTPHEDHPSADNFETMPEVESAPTQRLRGVLDALSESERLNTINPKNRKRPKEAKGADAKLIKLINELAEDQDPNERRFLKVMASMLQDVKKQYPRSAYERRESRKDRYATIREFIEKKLGVEPTATAPNLGEILSRPTTPSTRPASAYYGRATKKLVDQALSSEPTGFDPKRSGIDLPTKGDLREMLSQEQRLKRAKEDLRQVGVKYRPSFPADPRSDIMSALSGYLNGPYVELEQERIREMERGLKIALRDSKDEELEQVKDETARFWREWGGEYKRLQRELVTERTQGEALRNIRPLIPDHVLTPEINQLLDQMEQELDQRPVTGHDVARWIDTRDTHEATRDRQPKAQPTTPREQLTETAREVTRGADNFETMPEVEAPAREQLAETVRNITAPSSPLNIDQANAQDTLTEDRTRSAESKAADKALIESARELAKTSERGEEIKSALVDLMNAQQLKRYKRATGDMSARAEDMIEKRREARERLRSATSGEVINNFETMPETEAQPKKQSGPDISRYKRALSLAKKGKRLDKLTNGRRSKASREADQALISIAQEILEKDLGDVEVRTIYRKPSTMWTREESLKVAIGAMAGELKTRQRALGMRGGAEQAQELRADAREKLIDAIQEHVDRFLPDEVIDARLDRDLARDARETAKQEAREAQEARLVQQKTFTPEIQSAIESLKSRHFATRGKSYPLETYLKTRKDGGIYRTTETPAELADRIAENLPDNLANLYDFGEDTLRALITKAINEGVEARETPAELKDRIGSVITKRAQDNAASQKAQITGEGQRKALIEMKRNIKTLSGDGHFNEYRRGGERSYMGLGAIEKTLDMSERLSDLYVDAIFRQALPPELERFKTPVARFEAKAADQVAGAFANKYETVGEIRDNISTIREQMRSTIKSALDQTTDALVKRPTTLDLINQSYEKATERLNTDRQKNIENARALAQYTDDPQAHLAEIQELERQSDQAIAEQMEINREFARAYIHEASDLAERVLETTKGEVIDNVMSVKTPKHADKFTATVRGKANQKLMARIFNEVFEQVRREIGDEPIERGEKHPRNIANTVKKPSKTPAQFRGDIERADEEKRARKLAEREARRARRTQKSANHLIDYRAQLLQTIERIA